VTIPVATVVTQKSFKEYLLLKYSLEQYHACKWYVSCDSSVHEKLKDTDIVSLPIIKTDDCDHNLLSQEKRDNWMNVMMTKFDVCSLALEENDHVLFLDSDMVFVNPIEESVLNLLTNENLDAMVCQHMTNNWANEAKHGYFNAGMFVARSIEFLNAWQNLSKRYKELNMYFEQQPLEFIQRNFVTLNLPINYDIGWWRFNEPSTRSRLQQVNLLDDKIAFGSRKAINFHMHTLKSLDYQNFGQFLVDHVLALMNQSENKNYKNFLEYYDENRNTSTEH
tara:strand:- start:10841 stop:11677 length:837 start_codon:yes stop_codon:yes gene_type:complete